MTPRPDPKRSSEFEPALRRARHGQAAEALAALEHLIATEPMSPSRATPAAVALAELARHAERAHDLAVAERALALATGLRPRFPDLQHQYACVLLQRRRLFEARRALEAALAANPRYVAARVELALLDAREGMVGEALGTLRGLADQGAIEDPRAFQLGIRSLERAEWEEADALLRRALNPADPELADSLERFHESMRQEDPERALEVLGGILPQHDGYPDLHYLVGRAELRLGHVDDALASLGRALELNPGFHEARMQLAAALEQAGMSAAALEQAHLVLQHDPEHAEARAFVAARARRPGRRAA